MLAPGGSPPPATGMIMAAGVMITVPTVCFFAAVQRYLVQGWGRAG